MMHARAFACSGILVTFLCMILLSACDAPSTSVSAQVGYQPPFLPVVFAINNDGTISASAQGDIVTPIGTFSVAAGGYPIPAGVAPRAC